MMGQQQMGGQQPQPQQQGQGGDPLAELSARMDRIEQVLAQLMGKQGRPDEGEAQAGMEQYRS
jgi:hypothetical protein